MHTNLTAEDRARGRRKIAANARETAEGYRWVLEPLAATELSLAGIARELNERRIVSPAGKKWYRESVRRTLQRLNLYAVG